MSYLESRIEKSTEAISPYISNVQTASEICKTTIQEALTKLGVTDSQIGIDMLTSNIISFDEFEMILTELLIPFPKKEIPKPRIKYAWSLLTAKVCIPTTTDLPVWTQQKPIGQWSDLELLNLYNKECPPDVEDELNKRARGRYTIIFNNDGTVDVENSLYMIRKARTQEMPSTFMIKDQICQLYHIGEFPMDVLFECPVHSNILLVDGYCEECGRKWDTNQYDKNVFFRLITQSEKVDLRLYKDQNLEQLQGNFPKVFLQYKELKDEGRLPSLKRKLSKTRQGDPFRVSTHKVY